MLNDRIAMLEFMKNIENVNSQKKGKEKRKKEHSGAVGTDTLSPVAYFTVNRLCITDTL